MTSFLRNKTTNEMRILLLLIVFSTLSFQPVQQEGEWGFFGHRRINRLAVFTLPPEMMPFFKRHIEFLTEHAVDPDKRRYATKYEAPRHFIDIDHWGEYPFPEVPRNWLDALAVYTDLYAVLAQGDTLQILGKEVTEMAPRGLRLRQLGLTVEREACRNFVAEALLPQYYEENWTITPEQIRQLLGQDIECREAFAIDRFSEYGVLPYWLPQIQNQLTEAFRQGSTDRILRLAAEIGHYIGDAHVPLHTTENYNGQLTNQEGIHAFWESRIPELFADEQYNFFVGKAEYIQEPKAYYWDVVLSSHRLVDSVLTIEKELSQSFPRDKQYCFEERLGRTIRTYCEDYAAAYQERLRGQVERRMCASVLSIGSVWYTAWVDAGQPDLTALLDDPRLSRAEREELEQLEESYRKGEIKGRRHNE